MMIEDIKKLALKYKNNESKIFLL